MFEQPSMSGSFIPGTLVVGLNGTKRTPLISGGQPLPFPPPVQNETVQKEIEAHLSGGSVQLESRKSPAIEMIQSWQD